MQRDFLEPDGWLSLTGGDIAPLQAIVPAVARLLEAVRRARLFVAFTAEAYRPDLSDLPGNRLWRSQRLGQPIGGKGPLGRHLVLGEAGTDMVASLAPRAGEPVAAKPGKSAFIGTDLDHLCASAASAI